MKLVYRAAVLKEVREAFAWYLSEAGQRQATIFRVFAVSHQRRRPGYWLKL